MKKKYTYIIIGVFVTFLGTLSGCSSNTASTDPIKNPEIKEEVVKDEKYQESFSDPNKIIERALNTLIYKNTDFNIELQYPTIYKIERANKVISGTQDASIINFYDIVKIGGIDKTSNAQPDFWITMYDNTKLYTLDALVSNPDFGRPPSNVQEVANSSVAGYESREVIYSGLAPKITTIIFIANKKIYEISTFGVFSDVVRKIIDSIIIVDSTVTKEVPFVQYNSEKNELGIWYPERWSVIDLDRELRLYHDAAIQNPEESFQMIIHASSNPSKDSLYKNFLTTRLDNNTDNISADTTESIAKAIASKYMVKNVKNSVWKSIPFYVYFFSVGGQGLTAECLIPLASTCEQVINRMYVYDLTPASEWNTYRDVEESFTFDYPRSWGSISKAKTPGTLSGYKVVYSFDDTNATIGGATDDYKNRKEDNYVEGLYDFSYFTPIDKGAYNLVYPQTKIKVKADRFGTLLKSREDVFFVFTQNIKKEQTDKDVAAFVNLFNPQGIKGLVVQYKNYLDNDEAKARLELLVRSLKKIQ